MAVPNMWRIKKQRYSLQGEICTTCDSAVFPPRQICPKCGSALDGHPKPQAESLEFATVYQPERVLLVQSAGDD